MVKVTTYMKKVANRDPILVYIRLSKNLEDEPTSCLVERSLFHLLCSFESASFYNFVFLYIIHWALLDAIPFLLFLAH